MGSPLQSPLQPSPALLCKMGSIVGHADEYHRGPDPHPLDLSALIAVLADPEVQAWMDAMRAMAMVPVPRHRRPSSPTGEP